MPVAGSPLLRCKAQCEPTSCVWHLWINSIRAVTGATCVVACLCLRFARWLAICACMGGLPRDSAVLRGSPSLATSSLELWRPRRLRQHRQNERSPLPFPDHHASSSLRLPAFFSISVGNCLAWLGMRPHRHMRACLCALKLVRSPLQSAKNVVAPKAEPKPKKLGIIRRLIQKIKGNGKQNSASVNTRRASRDRGQSSP